jgi:hypothetical protein
MTELIRGYGYNKPAWLQCRKAPLQKKKQKHGTIFTGGEGREEFTDYEMCVLIYSVTSV